ncbi:MAG: prephenate dehydrogenase/arogenate dehydrogenase family protein, partial [Desulfobacterales bacterium]|nr:prephenate dehydrogenase/arogenate dehydrogenase family protein [Desulfobacterales bacterium]
GIIGGTGKMGSWFADLMERHGSEVFRLGRKTTPTPAEMAPQCDVVVISVPVDKTVDVIEEIGPLITEDALLMDLTSIKKKPLEAMLKYSRAQVVGAHPLFGHDIASDSELRVAICAGRGETGLNWLIQTLQDDGLNITVLSAEEHDNMMGLIQGVNHFSTLTLALFISRSGLKFEDILNSSTQTFRHRLNRIKSILEQPSGLFGSLMIDNPYAEEFMDQYARAGSDLIRIIREKDKEGFEEVFQKLKAFFSD